MDELKTLYDVCKEIDVACKEHIERGIKVLLAVEHNPEQAIKQISTAKPLLKKETYTDMISNVVETMIKDTQNIKNQLPIFVNMFTSLSRSEDFTKCSLLAEVWYGDAYGTKGVGGLKELLKEIRIRTKELTVNNVIKRCCE